MNVALSVGLLNEICYRIAIVDYETFIDLRCFPLEFDLIPLNFRAPLIFAHQARAKIKGRKFAQSGGAKIKGARKVFGGARKLKGARKTKGVVIFSENDCVGSEYK